MTINQKIKRSELNSECNANVSPKSSSLLINYSIFEEIFDNFRLEWPQLKTEPMANSYHEPD